MFERPNQQFSGKNIGSQIAVDATSELNPNFPERQSLGSPGFEEIASYVENFQNHLTKMWQELNFAIQHWVLTEDLLDRQKVRNKAYCIEMLDGFDRFAERCSDALTAFRLLDYCHDASKAFDYSCGSPVSRLGHSYSLLLRDLTWGLAVVQDRGFLAQILSELPAREPLRPWLKALCRSSLEPDKLQDLFSSWCSSHFPLKTVIEQSGLNSERLWEAVFADRKESGYTLCADPPCHAGFFRHLLDYSVEHLFKRLAVVEQVDFFARIDPALEQGLLPPGMCGLIDHVILPLIRNSLSAFGPQGEKRIVCQIEYNSEGREWKIALSDSGPGISEELRSRIFERSYSGTGERHRGRGLPLARGYLDLVFGRENATLVAVPNPEGKGACFLITLKSASITAKSNLDC